MGWGWGENQEMFKYNLDMKVINKRELVLVCNEVIQGGGGGG